MDQATEKIAGGSARVGVAAATMVMLIHVYQRALSPLLGVHCRYEPTCSRYAAEALRTHGAVRGSAMAIRRLLRCHPFGGRGYDPVPRPLHECAEHDPNADAPGNR